MIRPFTLRPILRQRQSKLNKEVLFRRALLRNQAFSAAHSFYEKRRKESGVSQKEIALRLGKQPSVISRSLAGPANWTLDTLADLAFALDGQVEIIIRANEDIKIDHSASIYNAFLTCASDDPSCD